MLNAATPGTLVVLAATVLLIIVTCSTPITKSINFLSADLSASVSTVSIHGKLTMGVFGYCLDVSGTQTCSNTTLGYSLDVSGLLGVDSQIAQEVSGISNSLIKWLTYVLILHPIAAGLAGIAAISGAVSHIREFSRSCFTSCFASFAATIAFLAFLFDIIVFSIAKSRLNSSSVGGSATLGNGIWMTLAAFLLLAFSGCFFCAGRCLLRKRGTEKGQSEQWRPQGDAGYNDRMRSDAEYAEKRRAEDQGRRQANGSSLPAFAEFGNEERQHETIPLNSLDREGYSDHDDRNGLLAHPGAAGGAEALSGVGVGYGRRNQPDQGTLSSGSHSDLQPQTSLHPNQAYSHGQAFSADTPSPSVYSNHTYPEAHQASVDPRRQGSGDPYANLPPHVEPATAYMSPAAQRPLEAMPVRMPDSGYAGHGMGYTDPYETSDYGAVAAGARGQLTRENTYSEERGSSPTATGLDHSAYGSFYDYPAATSYPSYPPHLSTSPPPPRGQPSAAAGGGAPQGLDQSMASTSSGGLMSPYERYDSVSQPPVPPPMAATSYGAGGSRPSPQPQPQPQRAEERHAEYDKRRYPLADSGSLSGSSAVPSYDPPPTYQ